MEGVAARGLGGNTPRVRGAPPGHPARPLRGAIKGAKALSKAPSKAPWFPRRFWKICALAVPVSPRGRRPLCGARPTFEQVQGGKKGQAGWGSGARPRRSLWVPRVPRLPSSSPACLPPASPRRPGLGGIGLAAIRLGVIPEHSREAADPLLDLARIWP